jgi:hypothetical protein
MGWEVLGGAWILWGLTASGTWCVSVGLLLIFDYGEDAQSKALDDNVYTAVLHMGWSRMVISRRWRCCDF